MAESRKAVHAFLSDEAHEAWHEFAAENGVSVSALLEVLPKQFTGKVATTVVKQARTVDAARRRRTR